MKANTLSVHSKDQMYVVDSGGCVHMLRNSSLTEQAKKTINGLLTSDTEAELHISELDTFLWEHLVEHLPSVLSLGRLCSELGYPCSWPPGESLRLSKGKRVVNCSSKNFVPMGTVMTHRVVPSSVFPTATGER